MRRSLPSSYSYVRFFIVKQLRDFSFRKSLRRKLISLALILSFLTIPGSILPSYQLPALASTATDVTASAIRILPGFFSAVFASGQSPEQPETLSDRIARVSHIDISPGRFVGYQGQTVVFNALPTDSTGSTIQGVRFTWQSLDPDKIQIDEQGRATLLQTGLARIACSAGVVQASVPVLVRPGQRPTQTDAQWRADQNLIDEAGNLIEQTEDSFSVTSITSALLDKLSPTAQAQITPPSYADVFYDEFYTEPRNLIGSPRNRAAEAARMGTVHPEGSNLTFAVPILNLGGRGVGVDLTLYYNSRVWSRHGNGITFDPVYSWPAPGFTLGFGRVITYGPTNALKYVFIDRDGTRRYLGQGGTASQTVTLQTSDGTHITYVGNATTGGTLFYNNGTRVTITSINNRLLASAVQDSNGNYITITYKNNYEPMAIDYITDTLGRVIQFGYGVNGLSDIGAPGFGGTSQNPISRVLVQFGYQSQAISNSFSGLTVENRPTLNPKLLRDIRIVGTNNQYQLSYSAYGMAYHYSLRRQVSIFGQGGLERAATSFNYPTSASSLTDAPAFSQRTETATNSPTSVYSYATSTDAGAQTMTFTITRPDGAQALLTRSTNSSSVSNGLLVQSEIKNNAGASKTKSVSAYANDPGGSPQVQSVTSYDDAATPAKVDFDYDQYGNVTNKREYGFQVSGNWQVRRRTRFVYKTDTAYINAYLRGLVIEQNTYDALLNTNDADDVMLTKSTVTYDDYSAMGGMEEYRDPNTGQLPTPPPGWAPGYGASHTVRGNATGSTSWHDIANNLSYPRLKKYDVFGNVVKEQLSCCNEQTITTTQDSYWSQVQSVKKGVTGGPQLTSSFDYDFNTSAVTTSTDPNNLQKTYGYDAAMRFNDQTEPTSATVYTVFNDDNLTSTTTTTYTDAGVQKTITTTKTTDGWGRVIQEVDANDGQVNTTYDAMGRISSRTNPFTAGGQPGPSTSYTFDALGRTTEVTMPDGQKTTTAYNGSSVTVTDPVNRKIQQQTDGLGRLVTANEQDASGALTQGTSYTYDLLNNLTQVNQGGQLRSFKYDALGRMLFERIPEQQATINDGTGTYWTTKFTYTSFNAAATRQDARGVIATYGYDTLHRLTQVSYNTVSGVTTAPTVTYTYDSYGANTSSGDVVRVQVGTDWEEWYGFDSNKRVSGMTRKLGTAFYTTGYQYNDGNQMTRLTYPSGRAVTIGHDSRGRASGLTDVATGTNYLSNVGYNEAGQMTGSTLGNGVVEVYSYDANRLQLTGQKAGTMAPYTNRLNLTYNYQATAGQNGASTTAGNTSQLIGVSGTINGTTESASYTYDLQGRLATSNQTTNGTSAQRRFAYDRWGNRTGVWDATSGGNQIQTITIAQTSGVENNRINVASGQTYTYDAAGNVTGDGLHTYSYDSENRLVSVDAGATAQYSYDHQNRRWKKVASGTTTLYMWEASKVIAEHNGSTGAVVVDYIRSGSRMIAKVEGGTTRYFLSDGLSARVVMDGSGVVLGRQGHLPFGEELGASGTTDKQKFTSYERDADAGLDYAINRWYSQATGRFQSADPYRPSAGAANPQSWNRYSYVHNMPVNATDPSGLNFGLRSIPGICDSFLAGAFCEGWKIPFAVAAYVASELLEPDPAPRTCSINLRLDGPARLRQNPFQGPRFKYRGLGPYNTSNSRDINNQFWLYFYEIEVIFPNGVGRRTDWHFEASVTYGYETRALVNGRVESLDPLGPITEDDTPFDQNTGWIGNVLYAVDTPALSQWDGSFTHPIVEGKARWEFTWQVKIGTTTICERRFQMELTVPLDDNKAGPASWVITP